MSEKQRQTLAEQLQTLALEVAEAEEHRAYASHEIHKLRGHVAILWDVAYEQLDRGEAFYALVKQRTGQTREQAERYFLPDNVQIEGRAAFGASLSNAVLAAAMTKAEKITMSCKK
jgi:hypothetical protein